MNDPAKDLIIILEMTQGYAASRVLTTAAKLGLFSNLDTPLSPETAAVTLGLPPKGVRYLCDALVALGIFEKRGERFQAGTTFRRVIEAYPGILDDLIHHDHLYDVWGRLEQSVRSGKSVPPPKEETRRYPASLETFLRAMRSHADYLSEALFEAVSWEEIQTVLDIGGGGGGHAINLTRRFPGLWVTIADLPDAVDRTREIIGEARGTERIRFHPCNAYVDPLPRVSFDRVLISHLIHIYPAAENRALVTKAAACLRPGGDLLLLDYFLDETETRPKEAVLFRLLMMVGTPEGDCYRLSEALRWLEQAFLTPYVTRALPRGNTLIAARKGEP